MLKGARPIFNESVQFYENVLASLSDGVMVLDCEGRIVYANPAVEQLCRVSFHSVKGAPFAEFSSRNPHLESIVQKTLATGASLQEMDYPYRATDGSVVPVLINTSIVSGPKGTTTGLALTFRDMRYFKEMEDNTKQAERLNLLGRMAAVMAHEIKNPLGGIRGSAQLLDLHIVEPEWKNYLKAIIKEVDRINRIVENALDIGRDRMIQRTPVNIHKVLNEILILEKSNEKSAGARFLLEFDPSIPEIPADEGRLIQAFYNLIRNGVEAMDGKGDLVISTRISAEYQVQRDKKRHPTRMLLVEVRDQGKGIPDEVRKNLFTPFFTTKKKGTGLGLVVVRQIVERHNGRLKLDYNPTGGVSAKVLLPLN